MRKKFLLQLPLALQILVLVDGLIICYNIFSVYVGDDSNNNQVLHLISIGDNMEFKFSKELYPKIALLKSAYSFTDRAYIHLDTDEKNYIVKITPKRTQNIDLNAFENEMLAQTARYEVYRQTKDIRRLTVARALASTVIEHDEPKGCEENEVSFNMDEVLKNWFDNNE